MPPPVYSLTILKKIKETLNSVSFVLSPEAEHKSLFIYTPAQFLTFYFNINGRSYRRSYSISSCPLLNEELKTTVKLVKGGVVSRYMIHSLKEGDVLQARKPAGRFFKPPKDLKPRVYYFFAGGSGITPIFSIIKTVLLSDPHNKAILFYANTDEQSIIYKKELEAWQMRFSNFRIVHILSQAKENWCFIKGRLTKEHLTQYMALSEPEKCLFYLCGPVGFMNMVEGFLTEKSILKSQIYKESFVSAIAGAAAGAGAGQKAQPAARLSSPCEQTGGEIVVQAPGGEAGEAEPKNIRALINGALVDIPAQKEQSILEQLLAAGHSPPFSCMAGACMSCLAVLKKGRIRQLDRGILEDSQIKRSEILTCQARSESAVVEVDYDV